MNRRQMFKVLAVAATSGKIASSGAMAGNCWCVPVIVPLTKEAVFFETRWKVNERFPVEATWRLCKGTVE